MKLSNLITLFCILAIVAIKMDWFNPEDVIPVVVDPFPGDGARMLVVYQTEDVDDMPASQSLIFTSTLLRQYLDDKGTVYRFLDADVAPKDEPWKSAFAMERGELPWVYYSNGVTGFSKGLPGSREELQHNIESLETSE